MDMITIGWCVAWHLRARLRLQRKGRETTAEIRGANGWGCRRSGPHLEGAILDAIGAVGSAQALERGERPS